MSGTLLDLAERLEKRVQSIDEQASAIAQKAALAVVEDLINATPVDTSRALSNWQVGIGSQTLSELPPYSPGYHGSTRSASASEALNVARSAIGAKKPGEKLYIFNNVDYIEKLNAGSSWQAPAGFVERAVLIGGSVVEGSRIK